jgi:rsbT co-antagonist protein RsbR
VIPQLFEKYHGELLSKWIERQIETLGLRAGQTDQAELRDHSTRFIAALRQAASTGQITDIGGTDYAQVREILEEVSRSRALKGFSPTETATFIFSMKEPLFSLLRKETGKDGEKLAQEIWNATLLLDKLGLYTTEVHQKNREGVIQRQQAELMELSTPVVKLWDGILALPLIGTLDSERTQVVMESLLEQVVSTGSEIAIIDITGVPTVDTLVAQHLLKTVAAARLMGADCIISGIRPQIAQTLVHLGVTLDVVTKSSMADAFALALRRRNKVVVDRASPKTAKAPVPAEAQE